MAKQKRPEPPTVRKQYISLYTDHPSGGCADIGTFQLQDGWVLMRTSELEQLRAKADRLDMLAHYARCLAAEEFERLRNG